MDLSNLKPAKGSIKKRKRIARGEGSTRGGTATRGNKGAQSRSGYSRKFGFEGGQMPIQRRLPKRGFKNRFRIEYRVFNLDDLQALAEKNNLSKIDFDTLRTYHLIRKSDKVKILGRGELKTKLEVNVQAVSASAKAAIEAQGGSVNLV